MIKDRAVLIICNNLFFEFLTQYSQAIEFSNYVKNRTQRSRNEKLR